MRGDVNSTEADLTPFNAIEILSENNFTINPLDSTFSIISKVSNNKSYISNKTSKSNSSFKLLIREDYSWYIQILIKIYGEEGDINNWNFGKSSS